MSAWLHIAIRTRFGLPSAEFASAHREAFELVNMPVLRTVAVWDYGLYPGLSEGDEAVEVDLSKGLTLVLGANGIGKSTFVSLLFRMLTGPFDIPGAVNGSLGRANLEVRELSTRKKRYFADRVNDGAGDSVATLQFDSGSDHFTITRRLRDLSLIDAACDRLGKEPITDELELQELLAQSAGLGSFSDWVLLLRYITFFQEDRSALVWDAAAQRQVLRPLFLSPDDSNSWVAQERRILQLDSDRRNTSAVLFRTNSYMTVQKKKVSASKEILEELNDLEMLYAKLLNDTDDDSDLLAELDKSRKESRLEFLLAESALEDAKRDYEHVKLAHIANALPDQSSSAKYILAQIISSGHCVACGQDAAEYTQQVERRIENRLCPLCGQNQQTHEGEGMASLDERRLGEALQALSSHLEQAEATRSAADQDDAQYRDLLNRSRESRYDLSAAETRMAELQTLLPEPTGEMKQAEAENTALNRRLVRLDAELTELRAEFQLFIEDMTSRILGRAAEMEKAFETYASAFLIEKNSLTYAPLAERVGQMGATVPFPHFGLNMSGNDFASPTARSSSDSVSESQREFIDLAFRMALVGVASANAAGTLVIDSPDSSLDAVFEPKAAEVLNVFVSTSADSKIILTSNLSSGKFLPELVAGFRESGNGTPGLVDMFEVAAPTAAVRSLRPAYDRAREQLFEITGLMQVEAS